MRAGLAVVGSQVGSYIGLQWFSDYMPIVDGLHHLEHRNQDLLQNILMRCLVVARNVSKWAFVFRGNAQQRD